MGNFIVIMILLIIFSGAGFKLYKDKKNNVMCSGCPSCPSNLTCSKSEDNGAKIISEPIVFLKKI